MSQLNRVELTRAYAANHPDLFIYHDPEDNVFGYQNFSDLLADIPNPKQLEYEELGESELKLSSNGYLFGPQLETQYFRQPPPAPAPVEVTVPLLTETEYSYRDLARFFIQPEYYVWLNPDGLKLYTSLEEVLERIKELGVLTRHDRYFFEDGEDVIDIQTGDMTASNVMITLAGKFSEEDRAQLKVAVRPNKDEDGNVLTESVSTAVPKVSASSVLAPLPAAVLEGVEEEVIPSSDSVLVPVVPVAE